ncbi:MAG: hypothetical protein NTZ12_00630 [Candidatus Aminicenantes bacterium]|nr:hypothetical protein [Candidatus Aminicenantes bacterium]
MIKFDMESLKNKEQFGINQDLEKLFKQHDLSRWAAGPLNEMIESFKSSSNAAFAQIQDQVSILNKELMGSMYDSLGNIHEANASILKSYQEIASTVQLADYNGIFKSSIQEPKYDLLASSKVVESSLSFYANIALEAEKSSANLFASNFLNASILDPIQSLQIDFQNQYGELQKNIFNKDFLTNLNPLAVTQFSSTELLLNNNLFETMIVPTTSRHPLKKNVKAEIQKRSNDVISKKLNQVSPVLLIALNGAREAIYSDNEDKCRHVVSSYRELIKKLIFKLTPVEKVKKWAPDSSYFLRDKPDTPTYKAHILYLTQESKSKDLNEFLWIDINLLIKQIRILDNLDHSDNPSEKIDNLETLSLRVENCIAFLLQFID